MYSECTVSRAQQRRAWLIFSLLTACYSLVSFFRTSASTLAVDIMSEFAVGGGLMSVMSAAYFYPYGLMQIPAGILSDRWGARKTISLFLLLGAGGALLFAFASSVFMATCGRVLIGIGMGMVFVPALRVILYWFPPIRHALCTGLLLSFGTSGMLLATYPLMALTQGIGWRGSMLVAAVFTVVLAGATWFWVRNRPDESCHADKADSSSVTSGKKVCSFFTGRSLRRKRGFGLLTAALPPHRTGVRWLVLREFFAYLFAGRNTSKACNSGEVSGGGAPQPTEATPPFSLRKTMKSIVRSRTYWSVSLWFFCMYGSFYAMTGLWAGAYFIQGYGMDKGAAGGLMFCMALGAVVGPSLVGMLTTWIRLSKSCYLLIASGVTMLLALPLMMATPVIPALLLPVWSLAFGIFCGGFGGIALTKVQEDFPPEIVGTATGMINIYSYIGTALLQMISGFIMEWQAPGSDTYDLNQYSTMFLLFMAMFVVSFVMNLSGLQWRSKTA